MSDLATVSAEIAPYLALAAGSLGTSVLTAAQDRLAERTVTAGEGFFRRLLHRRDGTPAALDDAGAPPLDTDRADALDALLATLDDHDRRLLATALGAWLRAPAADRDAALFRDHVTRLAASAGPRTVYNNPTTHGDHSLAAGEIHGTVNFGSAPRPRDDA
ncbi:hypothetical protein ADL22_10315 [Streptomyces sp. NRRL F-4489]|uniref:hypothetical protein n=1 Tax=Streptomyces sp. NRRL F-4489 TaxID=1609095 RepID=UPI000748F861|nr:hypothetical protein [Streptomyces sp. NRRL F-4489]KUL47323.1 hypothetical protein ADL22_10315 [Streptomyces sp. NRRL F-4489]